MIRCDHRRRGRRLAPDPAVRSRSSTLVGKLDRSGLDARGPRARAAVPADLRWRADAGASIRGAGLSASFVPRRRGLVDHHPGTGPRRDDRMGRRPDADLPPARRQRLRNHDHHRPPVRSRPLRLERGSIPRLLRRDHLLDPRLARGSNTRTRADRPGQPRRRTEDGRRTADVSLPASTPIARPDQMASAQPRHDSARATTLEPAVPVDRIDSIVEESTGSDPPDRRRLTSGMRRRIVRRWDIPTAGW